MRTLPKLIFLALMLVGNSYAQLTTYGFMNTMGTYTEITGGTLLGTTNSDDQYFTDPTLPTTTSITGPGIPIGFSFVFNEIAFDRIGVNNNGWIGFGQSALTPSVDMVSSSGYTPLSSTSVPTVAIHRNRIAGLARDLQAQAGSSLRVETIGSSPYRVCVIQFKNYKRYGTAGNGDLINFQIRLNETINTVALVYGSMNIYTTFSPEPQVGLGGSVSSEFANRMSLTSWATSEAGIANTSTMALSTTVYPALGLTYTWYPYSFAWGSINGKITDCLTNTNLEGVVVTIGDFTQTTTNSEGDYSYVPVPVGIYSINASKLGYNSNSVSGVVITENNNTLTNLCLLDLPTNVVITVLPEGLFNSNTNLLEQARNGEGNPQYETGIADKINVSLAQVAYPYSIFQTYTDIDLLTNGICSLIIPAEVNSSYYLIVNHRNSIQTWSSDAILFGSSDVEYDFTTNITKAYGSNLKSVGSKYCIFGGDVNQDGVVDTGDMSPLDNDAGSFTAGYVATDVNGDGIVDTGDMTIVDNNSASFIGIITPNPSDLPVVTTATVSEITYNSAICGGEVVSQGGSAVIARGVCWSLSPGPTLSDGFTIDGFGSGVYTSLITDLEPNTTYYVRAYATNIAGTAFGETIQASISITSSYSLNDIDGNTYQTIKIGNQTWLSENLKVIHYHNGDNIPNITDNSEWSSQTNAAYCWQNNDEVTYKNTYGALYNWYAVNDNRNLCPAGWHIPNESELIILSNFLGGESVAGGKLKSTRTEPEAMPRWDLPNTGANNFSGFNGLPGGVRYYDGSFEDSEQNGLWWGEVASGTDNALSFLLQCNTITLNIYSGVINSFGLSAGYSARCIRNSISTANLSTAIATEITCTSAICGGEIYSDGGSGISVRGICWSTSPMPTLSNNYTIDGSGIGVFTSDLNGLTPNTVYYFRSYATNSIGTAYGEIFSFTTLVDLSNSVVDIDGNVYHTVNIGTQTWMAENLKTTKYRDGSNIEYPQNNTEWGSNTSGAYAWYNNNISYKNTYGALYNYYAVTNESGLCPAGWHMPNDSEWTVLTNYITGGTTSGGRRLKSCRQVNSPLGVSCNTNIHPRWDYYSSSLYGTDNYEFSGLPGGYRSGNGYLYIGRDCYLWSSTEYNSGTAFWRNLYYGSDNVNRAYSSKNIGLSVRCVKDGITTATISTAPISDITESTAVSGGEITNNGGTDILERGICWSTNPEPTLSDPHTMDGNGMGAFSSTMTDLLNTTTYYVRAYATNSIGISYGNILSFSTPNGGQGPSIQDIDGNTYQSIIIGNQTWMQENLKVTHYRNGDPIPNVISNSDWIGLSTGAYCWYNNEESNKEIYGALYNWYTVVDSRNICPIGWHIPTDAERAILTDYLGGLSIAGGKIKEAGYSHWLSPNTGATNISGFTGLPGGYRENQQGNFYSIQMRTDWWTSTQGTINNYAKDWGTSFNFPGIDIGNYDKKLGAAVRCLMD